jgi:hypothetical protein
LENENSVTEHFCVRTYDENGTEQLLFAPNETIVSDTEDERVHVVRRLAAKFVNCCIHRTQMVPSFVDGVRVQELIEKIRNEEI